MEISKDNIAQWVIDNRYPKSEFEKISDMEMYHEIVAMIEKLINKNSVIPDVVGQSEQLSVAWKALEWVGFTKGEEFTDDDIQEMLNA